MRAFKEIEDFLTLLFVGAFCYFIILLVCTILIGILWVGFAIVLVVGGAIASIKREEKGWWTEPLFGVSFMFWGALLMLIHSAIRPVTMEDFYVSTILLVFFLCVLRWQFYWKPKYDVPHFYSISIYLSLTLFGIGLYECWIWLKAWATGKTSMFGDFDLIIGIALVVLGITVTHAVVRKILRKEEKRRHI